MTFSLYAATVPSFLQTLGAVHDLVGKAERFCTEAGLAHRDLIEARLIADMRPFSYQVKSVVAHSLGAVRSLPAGVFSPDTSTPPSTFDALRERVRGAIAALDLVRPDEIDRFEGKPMVFRDGDYRLDFLAEDFLMSFTMPNFYFHATTAYAILRSRGLPIGKGDFSGRRRTTPSPAPNGLG